MNTSMAGKRVSAIFALVTARSRTSRVKLPRHFFRIFASQKVDLFIRNPLQRWPDGTQVRAIRIAKLSATVLGLGAVLGCSVLPSDMDCDSGAVKEQLYQIARENEALLGFIKSNGAGSLRPKFPSEVTCGDDSACLDLIRQNNAIFDELRSIIPQCELLEGDAYDRCPSVDEGDLVKATRLGGTSSPDAAFKFPVEKYFYNSPVQTWPPGNDRERFMVRVWGPKLLASRKLANQIAARERALALEAEETERSYWSEFERVFTEQSAMATYDLASVILTGTSEVGARSCKAKLTGIVPGWGQAAADIRYTVEQTSQGQIFVTVRGN